MCVLGYTEQCCVLSSTELRMSCSRPESLRCVLDYTELCILCSGPEQCLLGSGREGAVA